MSGKAARDRQEGSPGRMSLLSEAAAVGLERLRVMTVKELLQFSRDGALIGPARAGPAFGGL